MLGREAGAGELAESGDALARGGLPAGGPRDVVVRSALVDRGVDALYRAVLGRAATADEVAAQRALLAQPGATLAALLDKARPVLARSEAAGSALGGAYQDVLGRAADDGALAYYQGRLAEGASLSEVRAGLAASDEAGAALRPVLRAALEREAGEAELSRAALAGGGSLQGVLSGLLHSDAAGASARAVEGLYEAALGRDADLGGLVYYEGRLGAGASVEEVRASLARSGEATAAVEGLYRSVLGRAADAAGYQDALAAGRSLAEVRAGLAHSAEAEGHARALFAQNLGRAPSADELRGFEAGLARSEAHPGAAGATFAVSTPEGAGGVGKLADADARTLVAELGVYVTLSGGLTPTLTAQDGTVLTFRNATELAGFALGVSQAQGRADKAAWTTAGLTVSWLDRVGQGYIQAARALQQGALASASAGDAQNAYLQSVGAQLAMQLQQAAPGERHALSKQVPLGGLMAEVTVSGDPSDASGKAGFGYRVWDPDPKRTELLARAREAAARYEATKASGEAAKAGGRTTVVPAPDAATPGGAATGGTGAGWSDTGWSNTGAEGAPGSGTSSGAWSGAPPPMSGPSVSPPAGGAGDTTVGVGTGTTAGTGADLGAGWGDPTRGGGRFAAGEGSDRTRWPGAPVPAPPPPRRRSARARGRVGAARANLQPALSRTPAWSGTAGAVTRPSPTELNTTACHTAVLFPVSWISLHVFVCRPVSESPDLL